MSETTLNHVAPETVTPEETPEQKRIHELEQKLYVAQRETFTVQARYDEHLARIGKRAMQLAREHDWCEVVEDALDELEVPRENPMYEMNVTVSFRATARLLADRDPGDIEEFIRQSLTADLIFDSDWGEEEIYETHIDVSCEEMD